VAVFNNTTSELPESQIEYNDNSGGRRIITLLIYIVLALAVAALVVFAGRWVYHKVSNNSNPAPTTISTPNPSQNTATSPPTASPTPTPSPAPTSKAPATTPATPPSSSSSSTNKKSPTATTPTPTPTTLPNNGPGEMIALFIGTSFAAAFLHFTVKLRKISKI
jgi:cytoskeletal protein RodZ